MWILWKNNTSFYAPNNLKLRSVTLRLCTPIKDYSSWEDTFAPDFSNISKTFEIICSRGSFIVNYIFIL